MSLVWWTYMGSTYFSTRSNSWSLLSTISCSLEFGVVWLPKVWCTIVAMKKFEDIIKHNHTISQAWGSNLMSDNLPSIYLAKFGATNLTPYFLWFFENELCFKNIVVILIFHLTFTWHITFHVTFSVMSNAKCEHPLS